MVIGEQDSAVYTWEVIPAEGTSTEMSQFSGNSAQVLWDGPLGLYTLQVSVLDGNGCVSETISQQVQIISQGKPPEVFAVPDFVEAVRNETITGDIGVNDFVYPDTTFSLKYELTGDVLPGLQLNEDGTFTYQPQEDFFGKVFFSYKVCSSTSEELCSSAEVEIRILSERPEDNARPVASTDVVLTYMDRSVAGTLLSNDVNYQDADISPLSITEIPVEEPGNGIVEIYTNGSFYYTPNPGFTGTDRFRYRVCSNKEPFECDSAWAYVIVNEFDSELQAAPVSAYDDLFLYPFELGSVADNDFSLNERVLIYDTVLIRSPENGSLRMLEDGHFSYTPDPGFKGIDRFVYQVCEAGEQNNCKQSTAFIIVGEEPELTVDAGSDTLIGSCAPYRLNATVSDTAGVTYNWSPVADLDDPAKANPVFLPGSTTLFIVQVNNEKGESAVDSVLVSVAEVLAEAGEDVYRRADEDIMLDGTASSGIDLRYDWNTTDGNIVSGESTPTPVVDAFGTYYLEVTDSFGCRSVDSVRVDILLLAPIAVDDYDTTSYLTEVEIDVLVNDVDPDNDLDSLSLRIVEFPFNGVASVNSDNYTISYTPDQGFSGNDLFVYEICDLTDRCSQANVHVYVTDYEFIIPDAFSPNGDNINDYFEIVGIQNFPGNSITILNRWGNKVFESRNYGISSVPEFWDGKSNTGFLLGDKDLPTGTYYYVLELGNGEKPIAGSIYLDR